MTRSNLDKSSGEKQTLNRLEMNVILRSAEELMMSTNTQPTGRSVSFAMLKKASAAHVHQLAVQVTGKVWLGEHSLTDLTLLLLLQSEHGF